MIREIKTGKEQFRWLDVKDPSEEEVLSISRDFKIHEYSLRDCLDPDHLPKHEFLGETNFILSRLLIGETNPKSDSIQEMTNKIAIFQNPGFLITIHKEPIGFLESVESEKLTNCREPSDLTLLLLHQVFLTYELPAIKLSAQVEQLETKVFLKHVNRDILEDLYYIKRKATVSHKLLLLSTDAINSIKSDDSVALQDLKDLHVKLLHLNNQIYEDVTNLLNVYLSISSQRTNDVVKVLTIFSAFFLPLTFIAGIYGMNFRHMPELNPSWGYPYSLILMAVTAVCIFIWMKRKRWL